MPSLVHHMLLLPSALLALSVSHALGAVLETRQSNSTTVPAPIAIAPDENWDGIDGAWSSFTLRVGTPQQIVRTLVSFTAYQTWVVFPAGCEAAASQSSCAQSRGGVFNQSASSTFDRIGIYDLWIEANLGYDGNAIYGNDTVGLGGIGENGPTLENTIVGGFAVDDFYLGVFGVNPKPTNFTSFNEPSPSYMTLLREQNYIPSISAAYTAGAQYRFTGVLASLTLGGYDESKFVANDVDFAFAADNERNTVVAIQSIVTPSQIESSPVGTELLPAPVYAFIDNTVPQIWLPLEACLAFEAEFGLVYDNATELYLVNSTLHQDLTTRNPNITFTLGQGLSGGSTVQIALPYAAFDLTAQSPYQGLANTSYYFPLRRAANDTQYTLGRTFLQEAYFSVNWDTARFNVSQCSWDQNAQQHLVALPSVSEDNSSSSGTPNASSPSSNSLGAGAIAGIVVGAVAAIALLIGLGVWYVRRRSRAAKTAEREKLGEDEEVDVPPREPEHTVGEPVGGEPTGREATVFLKAELEGSSPLPPANNRDSDNTRLLSSSHGSGLPGTPGTLEAPSTQGYFGPGGSSSASPTTPSGGEGTHSSTQSGSGRNSRSILSPLSPSEASEADSRERHVYEMPGDMPTIKEKDGRVLSEKEAIAHRERVYNGVDSAPTSAVAVNEGVREPRRVNPEDVVRADTHAGAEERNANMHRAFSFEDRKDESSGELYE
ncbi:hypothetical protein LTR36_001469 [Oleoguttula mirabilis]|uniref:Peptidase A1 domain-containing protein n=1 Tax=Oleoguttula mirabilis TaxID=1507867 RepID=A0AAV9J3B4_9PEZI|nr:hypothetical protein LTR36_001469 [Oleoguttula mirabilis]